MILGVDIGGTRMKAGLVDHDGHIADSRAFATPPGWDGFRAALAEIAAFGAEAEGVGFACKGIVNPTDTTIEVLPGTLHYLEGYNLAALIRPLLGRDVPVRADNDARVALAGEVAWGAARGHQHVLMLTLGTGVGGAAVVDGRILRGHTGAAGHMGHITVETGGVPCICGNRGCLETVFSARALEAAAFDAVHRGVATALAGCGAPTCRDVFDAAAAGDAIAAGILERSLRRLGGALAGLLFVFDPEFVILGGQIAEAGPALFDPLSREVNGRVRGFLRREVPLIPPQVADTSGIVGAAALLAQAAR